MPTRKTNVPEYDNHYRAAELHNLAEHVHQVGEHHGKEEHLNGHEMSREALEESPTVHHHAATVGHGIPAFGHHQIAALAHKLWEDRGCPEGSPEVDWFQAAEELRARSYGH